MNIKTKYEPVTLKILTKPYCSMYCLYASLQTLVFTALLYLFFFIQLREYKVVLDMSLPAPLDTVARWLLKTERALAEEEGEPQDHGRAADEAREKQELLKVNTYHIQPLNCEMILT